MTTAQTARAVTGRFLMYVVLIAVALSMLLPFLWMLVTCVKDQNEVFTFPPTFIPSGKWHWENFAKVLTVENFERYFFNSCLVTASIVLGSLFINSLAAYAFARLKFPGRNGLFMLYLATMMIPFTITLIPSYVIIFKLRWLDTYRSMIVPGLASAYGIFLLRQFFLGLPTDLEDAALIDGCGRFRIYATIFIPLSRPALATLGVFTFMGTWTDFLWPYLMSNSEKVRTLEVGLLVFRKSMLGWYLMNWPLLMTASTVVLLPVVVVFLFTQRFYVKGIALTGMKI
jgi:multiple sugar transport system permease protein